MRGIPHGSDDNEPFTRDRLTWLAYGMTVAFGFGVAAIGSAMPLLRADLGITRAVGGLHFTAIAAGPVLVGFLVERAVERWGRHRMFWLGAIGVAVGAALLGAGWHPAVTLSGSLLMGSSGAAMLAVSLAAISDRHSAHRAAALTEINTAMSAGNVLPGLVIGVLVAAQAGWRPAFLAPMAVFFVLAVVGRSEPFPPVVPHPMDRGGQRLPRAYWFFWGALIPSVGAEWSLGAWGAEFAVEMAGTSESSASFLVTTFFGAVVLGRFVGGRIARRMSASVLLTGASVIGLAGFLIFWGAGSTLQTALGLVIAGLGISMLFPMLLTMAMDAAADHPDLASARVSIAAGGATLVAPVSLGLLADRVGIHAGFAMVPGLFLLVVVLAVLGHRASAPNERDVVSSSS